VVSCSILLKSTADMVALSWSCVALISSSNDARPDLVALMR
jgi:hypothetical protein